MPYTAIIYLPFPTKLGLIINNDKLCGIDFLNSQTRIKHSTSPLVIDITDQLQQYFENPNFQFDIPLLFEGTDFQCKVWKSLTRIPSGKPKTYGELAIQLKTSARAIGNACRRNPIPIVIPCHRIVGKTHIGGFAGKIVGEKVQLKKLLLEHENHAVKGLK